MSGEKAGCELQMLFETNPRISILQDSNLPSIIETIQERQARYVGHCYRSKNKLQSNVLL